MRVIKNKILFLLIIAVIVLGILVIKEKLSFPVSFKVCELGYVNCKEIARFKDRYDCETTNKKWGWYCNQEDKDNIICQEKESDIATGFCD